LGCLRGSFGGTSNFARPRPESSRIAALRQHGEVELAPPRSPVAAVERGVLDEAAQPRIVPQLAPDAQAEVAGLGVVEPRRNAAAAGVPVNEADAVCAHLPRLLLNREQLMKPPLPRIESAVPRDLHVQLEIAKAVRTLFGSDDEELLRRRRIEIAAIRRDLDAFARNLPKAFEAAAALAKADVWAALREHGAAGPCAPIVAQRKSLFKDYDPEEPRIPKHMNGRGEWTDAGAGGSTSNAARELFVQHLRDVWRRLSNLVPPQLRRYHVIGANEIPHDSPKRPVQFLDSSGRAILDDQGKPMLRPDDLPPEKYAQAGAASHLADYVRARWTTRRLGMKALWPVWRQKLAKNWRHFSMAAPRMPNGSIGPTFATIDAIQVSRPASSWQLRASDERISSQ